MIFEIGSSIPTFKTLNFRPGLNILLADRSDVSEDTDTRNGVGKSSVIQIIHFLLGGSKTKTFLESPSVADAHFRGTFEFGGINVEVLRRVNDPSVVVVDFPDGIPDDAEVAVDLLGEAKMDVTDWTRWLGHQVFDLPIRRTSDALRSEHAPSFRSMFGYFARRREDGGFFQPRIFYRTQAESDARIALSYLFGLDWEIALEFEKVREERRRNKEDRKRLAARVDPKQNTIGRMINALAAADQDAAELREQVANFQVEALFSELADEADGELAKLEKLSREATRLTSSLRHLSESLHKEIGPDGDVVERMYREAGITLPGSVAKRFEDVKSFHESVLRNRQVHLAAERDRVQTRLAEINGEKQRASSRRSEILTQLEGKGAFSDLAELSSRLAEKDEVAARLRSQVDEARNTQKAQTAIKASENTLLARLQNDLDARVDAVNDAVNAVREARTSLYAERFGTFEINAKQSGPEFKLEIEGDRSGGISNMEIFCFDYALYKVVADRFGGPGFLIHDSHLFDGVDGRQQAKAIELGAALTKAVGGQYITMWNSDELDKLVEKDLFSAGFAVQDHVLPVVLQDPETGGLFGFRFD
ncbi:MAG: DUF2326 domain-containing protein [Rhizobium sp.]|nr:DUF2326 domain-containing protein [Rhizobium sp.]